MADYQLTNDPDTIQRASDKAFVPNDPANRDWVDYQAWLDGGNTPDPYVAPEQLPPQAAPETVALYDHENRLRALEGQPPLSMLDFITKTQGEPRHEHREHRRGPPPGDRRRVR